MPVDLIVILVVVLVLVLMWRGPKTLPRLGEALGRGVREARTEAGKAQAEIQARASGETTDANEPAAPVAPVAAPGAPAAPAPEDPNRPA